MVLRAFGAFDNEAFTVVTSPSPALVPGSAIINHSNTPNGTVFEYTDGFPVRNIILDDTDDVDIFNDNDEEDHVIVDGKDLIANGTEVESESFHVVRQLDSNGNPFGPTIQITVFSKEGEFTDIWGMSTDTFLTDGARYVKVDGTIVGDSPYDGFIPCFTEGTRIATVAGERLIEDLSVGDRVITRDNGMQEIRWIGHCTIGQKVLSSKDKLRPVLVRAGALGNGMPERDTYFSPNHRILLNEPDVAILYGESEVFAAAKDLTKRRGIARTRPETVTYVHVMFDRHEAILSNGMWSESFLPGEMAMSGLGTPQQDEIYALFPELQGRSGKAAYAPARRIAKPMEVAATG